MKPTFLTCTVGVLFSLFLNAQENLVTEQWKTNLGTQDMFHQSTTANDFFGNVYTVGATLNSNGDYDILIRKNNRFGFLIWDYQYAGYGNGDDVGVDIYVDNYLDVFVVGTVFDSSANQNDLVTLKLNSTGSLVWDEVYNGDHSGEDVGGAVCTDGSGNVFSVGGVEDSLGYSDMIVLKYNSSGTLQWDETWDHNNLHDGANHVEYLSGSSEVSVTGGAQFSSTAWQYASLKLNASNGNLNSSMTSGDTSPGYDEVHDVAQDYLGNIYIAGAELNGSGNFDFKIMKLDDSLNVVWSDTINGADDLDDVAKSVEVDGAGNVYVAGFTTSSSEGKNYLLVKYDNTGTEDWREIYKHEGFADDEATGLALDNSDKPVVTGTVSNGVNTDYLTIAYETNGDYIWRASFNGDFDGNDQATDITVNQYDEIVVSGQSEISSSTYEYITLQYETYERELDVEEDSLNRPIYVNNEIIIGFDSSVVNRDPVDNKAVVFDNILTFIDSAVVDSMDSKLGIDVDRQCKLVKIHKRMTTADSLSVNRLGDTINIYHFWSNFVLITPSSLDILDAIDSLNTIEGIQFAELNLAGEATSTPNDTYYDPEQASLHPTTAYPDAHINVEDAWDIELGQDYVKVGIVDRSVAWYHEDFGDGTFLGSKFGGGYNYILNIDISQNLNVTNDGHGTKVAGIIGAIRDNNIGVAGVAGGDAGSSNTGAALYGYSIMEGADDEDVVLSRALQAWLEAANATPGGFGDGVHIINNSFGYHENLSVYNSSNIVSVQDALRNIFKNNCISVCSRGNMGLIDPELKTLPAVTGLDSWKISVGASNTVLETSSGSSYGEGMDLIAPGVSQVVYSTGQLNNYGTFSGSSAAAPHVAGVAAFMMSHHNIENGAPNNLAPEDVEILIERNATDITTLPNYNNGYDLRSGFGRLDAGKSLEDIELPNYKVYHFGDDVSGSTAVLQSSGVSRILLGFGLFSTTVDIYKISAIVNHNINGAVIIDSWPRNSSSNLLDDNSIVSDEPDVSIESISTSQATISGYTYYIPSLGIWYPVGPNDIAKLAYSVHTYDASAGEEEMISEQNIKVYPNPANDKIFIDLNLRGEENVTVKMMDLSGKVISFKDFNHCAEGKNRLEISVSDLAQGIYFAKVEVNGQPHIFKIYKS